ncbi:Fc.00g086260.m01.CDS01 [Cosmosporella sp. VM-42]
MPRAKATVGLASLIESDSEPDLDHFDDSEIKPARSDKPKEAMANIKKPRGRPATANRVTKPASKTTRRSSGRIAAAAEIAPREALTDKSNSNATRAPRKMEKKAEDDSVIVPDQSVNIAFVRAKGTRGRPRAGAGVAPNSAPVSATRPRGRPPVRGVAKPLDEIPETQMDDPMEMDDVVEEQADLDQTSIMEALESIPGFDTSDVSIRRRLGELTKKYDGLKMRHRDLQEVGVKEAERNFERLRKQAEERTAAANTLISELKEELAAQTALAKQGNQVRKQLQASETKAKGLEETIEDLNGSLSEARFEIKTLSMKLAASRSAEANARVPGSALKPSAGGSRTTLAQAKEDLYGDLTGLLMRDVRRDETEDVFDCIQSGRNRTLHFKLAVERTDAGENYDDGEFTYKPQLDPRRDADLIDMLPDYLVEEITFPRPQASRFYARVIKALTERLD